MRWLVVVLSLGALAALGGGCSGCGDAKIQPDALVTADAPDALGDAMPDALDPNNPQTLFDTGLCVDLACAQISADARPYTPRFELYADGATKRRWIYLPPGTQIDTTDMDAWQFPVGTKLWKEFTRDGTRVETRLIMRIGPGDSTADWFYVAYAWNQAQTAALAVPQGELDANGTEHDIPSRAQCRQCHDNLHPTRVLGFSALQLDHENPTTGELDLEAAIEANLLTAPPSGGTPGARFPLPGTSDDHDVLGYLHANCGHCHNPSSRVYQDNGVVMVLQLDTGALATLAATPAYATSVDVDGTIAIAPLTKLVAPGDADSSLLVYRFESDNSAYRMPELGTKVIDGSAATMLRTWVNALP
jgi:hypothetical protein